MTMKPQNDNPENLEQMLKEKAANGYTLCYTEKCPLREHCLRWMARNMTPQTSFVATVVSFCNPQTQTETCPMYRSDQPIRMPLGLSNMYYDMPGRLERSLKHPLIDHFNRRVYYDYHSARQPLPPEHEQYIRQAALSFGWHEPLKFNDYVEKYLW